MKCNFSVFDVTGRLLFRNISQESLVLTNNDLPSGVYHVILSNELNTRAIKIIL